jgi:uncharacterized protein YjiS (DUF1127 family)
MIDAISNWWLGWTSRRSAVSELNCYAEEEIERSAKDLGISAAEIRKLVSRGPETANLLLRRMTALDLDRNEVSRTEPRVFQDLQRVCTLCESRRRCVRDLGRDSADPVWQDYCPNAETLMALNKLPWMSRREW